MVKLIASLICLLATSVFGQFTMLDGQWIDPTRCGYGSPNPANRMLEGFEIKLAGYENWANNGGSTNRWTLYGDTTKFNPTFNIDSLTTNKPTGSCNQALQFTPGSDGVEACASFDFGYTNDLSTASNYCTFNMMVQSVPAGGNFYYFFGFDPGGSPNTPGGGGLRLQRASASTVTVQWTAQGSITLNVGVWYAVRIYFDQAKAANGSSFSVWTKDPVPPIGAPTGGTFVGGGSFTREPTHVRYIQVGPIFDLETADNIPMIIDSVAWYQF